MGKAAVVGNMVAQFTDRWPGILDSTVLQKFGLSHLKLVDIGTKIIQIGPEMPILGLLMMYVQKSLFSLGFWQLLQYIPENTNFTTCKKKKKKKKKNFTPRKKKKKKKKKK